jgi:hypothetical protein
MRFAKNALSSAYQRGARVLGVVVNGITADNPYYYYNHYYHGYYRTGEVQAQAGDKSMPPSRRMAAPRRSRSKDSIDSQARAFAGVKDSPVAKKTISKADQFRARRAGMKENQTVGDVPSENTGSDHPLES